MQRQACSISSQACNPFSDVLPAVNQRNHSTSVTHVRLPAQWLFQFMTGSAMVFAQALACNEWLHLGPALQKPPFPERDDGYDVRALASLAVVLPDECRQFQTQFLLKASQDKAAAPIVLAAVSCMRCTPFFGNLTGEQSTRLHPPRSRFDCSVSCNCLPFGSMHPTALQVRWRCRSVCMVPAG